MKCQICGTEYEGNYCPKGCNSPNFQQAAQQSNAPLQSTPPVKKKAGCLQFGLIILGVFFAIGILGIVLNALGFIKSEETSSEMPAGTTVSSDVTPGQSNLPPTESQTASTYGLGEAAEYKGIKVTMDKLIQSEGEGLSTPADGNVFVVVEFTIENNTDKDISISSILSFDAYYDDFSVTQSISAEVDNGGKSLNGTVGPGKKINGILGYEVPSDWKTLEIAFQPSVWNNKKLTFSCENN